MIVYESIQLDHIFMARFSYAETRGILPYLPWFLQRLYRVASIHFDFIHCAHTAIVPPATTTLQLVLRSQMEEN